MEHDVWLNLISLISSTLDVRPTSSLMIVKKCAYHRENKLD